MLDAPVDGVYVALAFLVPGFVISLVRSQFTTGRIPKATDAMLRYLMLSAVNYAIFSWLVYLLLYHETLRKSVVASAALWLVIILAGPVCIGILLGIATQRDWLRAGMQRIGLRPIHVMPTSWDWQFARLDRENFVLVTLKDGSTVAGLFGSRSFASSDSDERDLYIEQIYRIDEQEIWHVSSLGHGIWLAKDDIRSIEFWPGS